MTTKELTGIDLIGSLVDILYNGWHFDCRIKNYNNTLGKNRYYLVENKQGRVFKRKFRHLFNVRTNIN